MCKTDIYSKAKEAALFIQNKIPTTPSKAIILGSGLGPLAEEVEEAVFIDYETIPHFPISTVKGHQGRLVIGKLNQIDVLVMQGRFHFYEGYSMETISFPIRVMKLLGIKSLFVSNAAGGLNPSFSVGDLMLITDQINMMGSNPLIGKNDERFGPRFPDMQEIYSKSKISRAKEIAKDADFKLQEGVYIALSGPCYETTAETRMYRSFGADAVGMSTAPETIVARHCGMECFAVSVITNMNIPDQKMLFDHNDVVKQANIASKKLLHLFKELLTN